MSCGIIARCDAGGLGTISREVFRHLAPDRTLLLDLGDRGRGNCAESAYDVEGSRQTIYRADFAGGLPDRAVEWLCAEGIDTLWSAETFYDDKVLHAARHNKIRTVCYAMPELAPWTDPAFRPRPNDLLIPTTWRHETLPGARLLAMPVATDRLPSRQRTRVEHLFHVTGKAMCDRNGTDILLRALAYVEHACKLTIRSEHSTVVLPPMRHNVDIELVYDRAVDYWTVYDDSIDLLVLPRRYGGLSLPIQECAALGVPTLALASDPYATEPFVETIGAARSRDVRMKGGTVPVYDADPRDLALAIDHFLTEPHVVRERSSAAQLWTQQHAWTGPLGDQWCARLDADCEQEAAA